MILIPIKALTDNSWNQYHGSKHTSVSYKEEQIIFQARRLKYCQDIDDRIITIDDMKKNPSCLFFVGVAIIQPDSKPHYVDI